METKRKPRVIFLCTGNSARSQMAEAFLRKYAGDQYEVFSAGLDPKGIHPYTLKVMEEIGINMDGHYSKSLKMYLAKVHFAYLFTVCSNAEKNCPRTFLSSGIHRHWEFEDPAAFIGSQEKKLDKFREVRDLIEARIKSWLAEEKQA